MQRRQHLLPLAMGRGRSQPITPGWVSQPSPGRQREQGADSREGTPKAGCGRAGGSAEEGDWSPQSCRRCFSLGHPAASQPQAGFPKTLDSVLSSSAFAEQPLYSGSIYRELNNFKSLK